MDDFQMSSILVGIVFILVFIIGAKGLMFHKHSNSEVKK